MQKPFAPLPCMLPAIPAHSAACAYAQPNSSCKAAFHLPHGSPIERRHIQPPRSRPRILPFVFLFFPDCHISQLACWSIHWLFTYINFARLVGLAFFLTSRSLEACVGGCWPPQAAVTMIALTRQRSGTRCQLHADSQVHRFHLFVLPSTYPHDFLLLVSPMLPAALLA